MTAIELIDKYYPEDNELKRMLLKHSRQVCEKALNVLHLHPELNLNEEVVREGAMLHDIGIYLTHAPSIHCYGEAHYLLHGYLGGEILRKEGLPILARICERHTGAGLTRDDIIRQQLPLPHEDFLPETNEEKVVCYADKFYSKSNMNGVKTPDEIYHGLLRFGKDGAERFRRWHDQFK